MRSNLSIVRLLVDIAGRILGKAYSDDNPRADMHLPVWLLGLALVLGVATAVLIVVAIIKLSLALGLAAVATALLGTAAFMCWKNQTIVMISENEFVYTTFLGNKKTYRFDRMKYLRKNADSMTLVLEDGKVHIESIAIITERLATKMSSYFE